MLVRYRVLKLSPCSPSLSSNPFRRPLLLWIVIGRSAHDFRERGSERGIKPGRPTETIGQFVLDDPSVPIEEKFEGSRILCIRRQIEENPRSLTVLVLVRVFFSIGVAIAHSPTRFSMYNIQIDFIQLKVAYR